MDRLHKVEILLHNSKPREALPRNRESYPRRKETLKHSKAVTNKGLSRALSKPSRVGGWLICSPRLEGSRLS